MADKDSIKLVVTIAERGQGNALAKLYDEWGVSCCYQCMGRGTASSELLDVLGLGTAEKDILLAIAQRSKVKRLFHKLENESGVARGGGIVFDMPLNGLNRLIATVLMNESEGRTGGMEMGGKGAHSLILIAVNQGHTDAVMDTAREAGARGGTVIRARWAGSEDSGRFYGISVQAEKEIIAIVASGDRRNAIMEMVNKKHGLKTEAGALICSVGIDHTLRLA